MPSFIGLCVLLGVGHLLRSKVKFLRWLYLPSCVIAGLVGLVERCRMRGSNAASRRWANRWA